MEPEATFNSVKEFIGMQHHAPAAAFRAAATPWSRTEFQAGENHSGSCRRGQRQTLLIMQMSW